MTDEKNPAEKPEIEVTPEMIEAGASILWAGTTLGEDPLESDRLLVDEIFREMMRLYPGFEEKHRSAM